MTFPAAITMSPPIPALDDPTDILIDPAAPSSASPVVRLIDPDAPELAVPVATEKAPLTPSDPASPVCKRSSPLEVASPRPVLITI